MHILEEEFKEFIRFKQFQQLKKNSNSLSLLKESSGINNLNGNSTIHVNGDHQFDEIEDMSNHKCFKAQETTNNYQNQSGNYRHVCEHELEEYNNVSENCNNNQSTDSNKNYNGKSNESNFKMPKFPKFPLNQSHPFYHEHLQNLTNQKSTRMSLLRQKYM